MERTIGEHSLSFSPFMKIVDMGLERDKTALGHVENMRPCIEGRLKSNPFDSFCV